MAPGAPGRAELCVQARLVQWFLTVQQFCSAIVKCLGPLDPARTAAAATTAATGRPRRPRLAWEGWRGHPDFGDPCDLTAWQECRATTQDARWPWTQRGSLLFRPHG